MTLSEIKTSMANYLHREPTELVVHGLDMSLVAINHVRQVAELNNDFNFTRKLVQLPVDGVVGGSLDEAVLYGTTTKVVVKSVVDVGLWDGDGNFVPVEWTTVSDSLNRQRADSFVGARYPTDAEAVCSPIGEPRFNFAGNNVYYWPRTEDTVFDLGIEAYTFTPDWDDFVSVDPSPWITVGSMYLLWAGVIHLNQMFKDFVFRQEGNLPPPQVLADQALASLMTWDVFRYEQSRRHSR